MYNAVFICTLNTNDALEYIYMNLYKNNKIQLKSVLLIMSVPVNKAKEIHTNIQNFS